MKRLYLEAIQDHLKDNRQMLFLMGPRQVGKTTTCRSLNKPTNRFFYFTWDDPNHRTLILAGPQTVAATAELGRAK